MVLNPKPTDLSTIVGDRPLGLGTGLATHLILAHSSLPHLPIAVTLVFSERVAVIE